MIFKYKKKLNALAPLSYKLCYYPTNCAIIPQIAPLPHKLQVAPIFSLKCKMYLIDVTIKIN